MKTVLSLISLSIMLCSLEVIASDVSKEDQGFCTPFYAYYSQPKKYRDEAKLSKKQVDSIANEVNQDFPGAGNALVKPIAFTSRPYFGAITGINNHAQKKYFRKSTDLVSGINSTYSHKLKKGYYKSIAKRIDISKVEFEQELAQLVSGDFYCPRIRYAFPSVEAYIYARAMDLNIIEYYDYLLQEGLPTEELFEYSESDYRRLFGKYDLRERLFKYINGEDVERLNTVVIGLYSSDNDEWVDILRDRFYWHYTDK